MKRSTPPRTSESPPNDARTCPRRATMRSASQTPQHSISRPARTPVHRSRQMGAATLLITLLFLFGPPAFAGVETHAKEGRRTLTGPKEAQIAMNGFPIKDQSPTPSGHTLSEHGRHLHARPTLRVLVGLMGCPGCDSGLEYFDGLYLGIDGRYINDHIHQRRARTRQTRNAHRRPRHNQKGSNAHD